MSTIASEQFIRELTNAQARLLAYIAVLLGNSEAARDVLQETNLVLWRKADEFADVADFGAWASTHARFQVLAYLRDVRRDRHHFDADTVQELAVAAEHVTHDLDERRKALHRCMEKLNPQHQRLVHLRYLESKSIELTAQATGRTVAGVVTTLGRIRRKLLECMQRQVVREGGQ